MVSFGTSCRGGDVAELCSRGYLHPPDGQEHLFSFGRTLNPFISTRPTSNVWHVADPFHSRSPDHTNRNELEKVRDWNHFSEQLLFRNRELEPSNRSSRRRRKRRWRGEKREVGMMGGKWAEAEMKGALRELRRRKRTALRARTISDGDCGGLVVSSSACRIYHGLVILISGKEIVREFKGTLLFLLLYCSISVLQATTISDSSAKANVQDHNCVHFLRRSRFGFWSFVNDVLLIHKTIISTTFLSIAIFYQQHRRAPLYSQTNNMSVPTRSPSLAVLCLLSLLLQIAWFLSNVVALFVGLFWDVNVKTLLDASGWASAWLVEATAANIWVRIVSLWGVVNLLMLCGSITQTKRGVQQRAMVCKNASLFVIYQVAQIVL